MQSRLACLLVVLLVPAFASAATVSYTTSTPVALTNTDWTSSLAFQQFNPTLGTLTKVQLDLSAYMETTLQITNTGTEASSGTAKTELQLTVQDAGNNLKTPSIDMFSPDFVFSLVSGESKSSGLLTKSGTSSDQYTSSTILSEFTGAGTIVLPASTYTTTWVEFNGGNTAAGQVTNAQLTGTVTYYYEVPEPATLVLLGLSGLGLLRRRSR